VVCEHGCNRVRTENFFSMDFSRLTTSKPVNGYKQTDYNRFKMVLKLSMENPEWKNWESEETFLFLCEKHLLSSKLDRKAQEQTIRNLKKFHTAFTGDDVEIRVLSSDSTQLGVFTRKDLPNNYVFPTLCGWLAFRKISLASIITVDVNLNSKSGHTEERDVGLDGPFYFLNHGKPYNSSIDYTSPLIPKGCYCIAKGLVRLPQGTQVTLDYGSDLRNHMQDSI
jgi:hypothetical protein